MASIDLAVGTRITRAELNARYGGGIQRGMITPAGGELMFLFSDPVSGKTYGYSTDGWADDSRTRYFYTGEGPEGPQAIDRGQNKVLLESLHTNREIHLFHAVGTVLRSRTRIHEYLGQFTLDNQAPWLPETTLDQLGEPRTAVVFNLVRVAGPAAGSIQLQADQPARQTDVSMVEREAAERTEFDRAPVNSSTVLRNERKLEDRLIDWLEARNLTAKRLRIRVAGERGALFTDTWVPETRDLFEVKGDATRNDVRMAVAQLLDYRRHIEPAPARATVVVPIVPSEDLIQYVAAVGLSLATFDSRGLTYLVERRNHE